MKKEVVPQEEKRFSAKVEENLPDDIYTEASKTLMEALVFGIFDDFENMLDDDVETILNESKTIRGKANVLAYWWDWRSMFVMTKKVTNFEVVMSRYYSHACMMTETNQLVMFHIVEGKISKILSVPMHLTYLYCDDNMLNYPLEFRRIKPYLRRLEEADYGEEDVSMANHIPCLHCGTDSQDLNWFAIRKPNLFCKEWIWGEVSVCPHCGRVVEYCEMRSEISDDEWNVPMDVPKYSDKGNEYSEYAEKMYAKEKIGLLKDVIENVFFPELIDDAKRDAAIKAFVDHIIPEPSEIKVDEGCRFDLAIPYYRGSGNISHIRIVDEEGNETEDLVVHLKVNATEQAVWQLYLLENYYTVLPAVGHGAYNEREFVFRESDVDDIIPLKYHDLTELIKQEKLLPFVEVGKDGDGSHMAIVNCSYWNKWKGLARERVTYKIKDGRVVYRVSKEEILFQFHCGLCSDVSNYK